MLTSMARLEFFFDISSPWTYLAFSRIEALAERMQAELVWRPILVGGVFNSVNQELYETRANPNKAKLNYSVKDIKDWADFCGVEINWPDIFPVNAVNIMRGAFFALDHDKLPEYARLGFEAYWRDGLDVSNPDILSGIAEACHLPANDKPQQYQTIYLDDSHPDHLANKPRNQAEHIPAVCRGRAQKKPHA